MESLTKKQELIQSDIGFKIHELLNRCSSKDTDYLKSQFEAMFRLYKIEMEGISADLVFTIIAEFIYLKELALDLIKDLDTMAEFNLLNKAYDD